MDSTPHKNRRQQEIQAVKTAILRVSRELARREGWPKVSIRKIAKEIAYTPPVIYEHFKNKEAILIELEQMGFGQLRDALDAAARNSQQQAPVAQIRALAEAHWEWAFQKAELYQVMFNMEGIRSTPPNPKSVRNASESVVEVLGNLRPLPETPDETFFHYWGLVHGHISLVMSGQITGMRSKMKDYLLAGIERLF